MGPIVAAVVLGAIGWGLYKAATGGLSDAVFVIKVRSGTVTIKGSVGGKAHNDVIEFVGSMALPDGAKISGVPDGDRVRLRFAGDIADNLQQRMRNYFMN
ncbi:MAG: DUF3634 family protein [Nannocystaceae bacterium]|nr:DUF3634 family protein [Nannocystaceae bacterium]